MNLNNLPLLKEQIKKILCNLAYLLGYNSGLSSKIKSIFREIVRHIAEGWNAATALIEKQNAFYELK